MSRVGAGPPRRAPLRVRSDARSASAAKGAPRSRPRRGGWFLRGWLLRGLGAPPERARVVTATSLGPRRRPVEFGIASASTHARPGDSARVRPRRRRRGGGARAPARGLAFEPPWRRGRGVRTGARRARIRTSPRRRGARALAHAALASSCSPSAATVAECAFASATTRRFARSASRFPARTRRRLLRGLVRDATRACARAPPRASRRSGREGAAPTPRTTRGETDARRVDDDDMARGEGRGAREV